METSKKLNWINKTQGKLSKGIVGTIFQCFIQIFPLWNRGDHCIFPLSNKPFHVCIGEIQVFLDGPILKRFVVNLISNRKFFGTLNFWRACGEPNYWNPCAGGYNIDRSVGWSGFGTCKIKVLEEQLEKLVIQITASSLWYSYQNVILQCTYHSSLYSGTQCMICKLYSLSLIVAVLLYEAMLGSWTVDFTSLVLHPWLILWY